MKISVHLSPPEVFLGFELPLLGNFSSGLHFPFKILAFKTLLPLGVFSHPHGVDSRELQQQRWRWLQKRHLKSEFALLQTLLPLFHFVYFVKCWQMFLELNSIGLYQTSGKEKESCCLVFPSLTKSKLRHFHFVVLQRWQRNLQKKRAEFLFCESKPTAFLLFSQSTEVMTS